MNTVLLTQLRCHVLYDHNWLTFVLLFLKVRIALYNIDQIRRFVIVADFVTLRQLTVVILKDGLLPSGTGCFDVFDDNNWTAMLFTFLQNSVTSFLVQTLAFALLI